MIVIPDRIEPRYSANFCIDKLRRADWNTRRLNGLPLHECRCRYRRDRIRMQSIDVCGVDIGIADISIDDRHVIRGV